MSNRVPSRFQSMLSVNSNKGSAAGTNIQLEEKAKLALLVKTWRAKFEKAHAANRQHSEYKRALEAEIERLKEEKSSVTTDLTTRLEVEQVAHLKKIKKLQLEAETARNEPEIEVRYLREKLRRLQTETKPIIEIYKKRDKEMENKMKELQEMIEEIKENEEKTKADLEKEIDEYKHKLETANNEVHGEKSKYMEQIEKVKKHCAAKIFEARQRIEQKAEEETKSSITEIETKYSTYQADFNKQLEEARVEYEEKFKENIRKASMENNEKLHYLSLTHAAEMLKMKKKLETAEVNTSHFKKEGKEFKKILTDATENLKKARNKYQSLVFWEFDGKMTKEQHPVACSSNLKDLRDQLVVSRRELREIKKVLDRYDDNQTGHFLIHMNQSQLMLEIDFNIKTSEIEYLRKLLRMKQLQGTPKRITTKKKPLVVLMQNAVVPDLPAVEDSHEEQIKHGSLPPPRKKSAPKAKVVKDEDSRRDRWLYKQPSTVQLNPAINGRQRWYDNEVKNKFG